MLYYNQFTKFGKLKSIKEESFVSKRKRTFKNQKKQSSPEQKRKRAKKAYYHSFEAKQKWDDKKARKAQSQNDKRIGQGISALCPLDYWEMPSVEKCCECTLKCSFKKI